MLNSAQKAESIDDDMQLHALRIERDSKICDLFAQMPMRSTFSSSPPLGAKNLGDFLQLPPPARQNIIILNDSIKKHEGIGFKIENWLGRIIDKDKNSLSLYLEPSGRAELINIKLNETGSLFKTALNLKEGDWIKFSGIVKIVNDKRCFNHERDDGGLTTPWFEDFALTAIEAAEPIK